MESMNSEDRIIREANELPSIGHRVVHRGELFQEPALIADQGIAIIGGPIPLAPRHDPSDLLCIEVRRERSPTVPQPTVLDTVFQKMLPASTGTPCRRISLKGTGREKRYHGFPNDPPPRYRAIASASRLGRLYSGVSC